MPEMFAPMATSDETNYTNDDLDAVYSGAHSLSLTRMMSQTKNYADYLIIGGGANSVSASNVIKANDPNSKILMVSNMGEFTVKQLDTTKFKRAGDKEISFHTVDEDAFTSESPSSSSITLLKNRKATRIDIKQSVTTLDDGWKVTFDEALSATGTAVYVPEYLSDIIGSDRLFERVIRLQSTDDLNKAKTLIDKNEVRFIVIIGSQIESVELACTLASKYPDIKVKLICYHMKGILKQMLPSWFVQRCRQALKSVDLLVKFKCDDVFPRLEVADMIFLADISIVDAAIEHDGLIEAGDDSDYIKEPELRIFDNIWCAGNACNLYDVMTKSRTRWTHHEGNVTTGRVAGTNMSCDKVANYRQQIPWLDIGKDMSIESVGRVHSSLDVDSVLFHF
ncbi:hypothetical protein GJ496_011334 [Pomphorhynchus laevis]|nr:hypothetical protein GJ496_011334 [Pomphorhynchus laevis]